MKNFSRVLRSAFRYRLTFVLSVLCALGVALLWGANIGVVYPFVEVVFKGESLQTWVDDEIEQARHTIAEKTAQIEQHQELLRQLPPDQQRDVRVKISLAESRIEAEQTAMQRYGWLKPYIDRYLPDGARTA